MDKLVVFYGHCRMYRIHWWLAKDSDVGGYLGQDDSDGLGDPPEDRWSWEHWAASKALREAGLGFEWDDERDAKAALRVAKLALKSERPLPDWAQKAIAAGWKPPKGWKA